MKSDSFHTVFSDKPNKKQLYLGQQILTGYKIRGKEHFGLTKRSQVNSTTPSEEKKTTQNISSSYILAMKALQDKIKSLEIENSSLQILMQSVDGKDLKIEKHSSEYNKSDQTYEYLRQKDYDIQLLQNQLILIQEQYEIKLQQLQQNILNITLEADNKYQEYNNELIKLNEKLQELEISNNNYTIKLNQINQSLMIEKQNYNHATCLIEQEKNTIQLIQEKNEKQMEEIYKLKQTIYEMENYMESYSQEYNIQIFGKIEIEKQLLESQIQDLNRQLQNQKDENQSLKLQLDIQLKEFQNYNLNKQQKLSDSNIKIELLKQQLFDYQQKQQSHINNQQILKRVTKAYKSNSQRNVQSQHQKIRDQRQIKERPFLTASQSYKQQSIGQKDKGNESQNSIISKLIVKTLEDNLITTLQKNEDLINTTDEIIKQQTIQQKIEQQNINSRIRFLDELLKSLNLKYEDIEEQCSKEQDLKNKKLKRQELIDIIDQMQNVNKELNDLTNLTKLSNK